LQFTLTISGLTASAAEALEQLVESAPVPPLATSRNEIDEAAGVWDVVAYFASQAAAREAAKHLAGIGAAEIAEVPDIDWVRRSLEGLQPVKAGRFYLYGSHDRAKRCPGGISLEIDAGTAFGSGHHPTTQGCLLALDAVLKRRKPRRILDIGCGTGILALAAAKALRVSVTASDIDPEAIRVTRANALRNGVASLVNAVEASALTHPAVRAGAPYDLILANILARPLIALAQPISRILTPGGILILSGLIHEQSQTVHSAYRSRGLAAVQSHRLGNWSTLVLAKANTRSLGSGC
jgi:ribosomal protein L11 methyltransferase